MQPLHVLLPDLEHAVERRRDAAALDTYGRAEIEQLLYQIVEHYVRELADPRIYLQRLVQQTEDRRDECTEATERSVQAREAVLRAVLEIIQPALPALLGPVPTETWNEPGRHGQRTDHPLLRGFELLDGMRKGPVGSGRVAVSGRSWWLVALEPDDPHVRVTARVAALDHVGELDTHREGNGQTYCDIKLVTIADAASQIRDDMFDKLIAAVVRRLRSVSSNAQKDLAARADEAASMLHVALRAMKRGG